MKDQQSLSKFVIIISLQQYLINIKMKNGELRDKNVAKEKDEYEIKYNYEDEKNNGYREKTEKMINQWTHFIATTL